MKIADLKLGLKVYDRWWKTKVGTVRSILKTRVKIMFRDGLETYDMAHVQFLEKVR